LLKTHRSLPGFGCHIQKVNKGDQKTNIAEQLKGKEKKWDFASSKTMYRWPEKWRRKNTHGADSQNNE